MNEYQVGDQVDQSALDEFARLLKEAYRNGAASEGQIDWNDVVDALDKAVEALGPNAARFLEDAAAGLEEEPSLTTPADAAPDVRAAAALLYAYRCPEDVEWEDVDQAWEVLMAADVERGIKPSL